jgi:hypothetical protein
MQEEQIKELVAQLESKGVNGYLSVKSTDGLFAIYEIGAPKKPRD